MSPTRRLMKAEREQLEAVRTELLRHGVEGPVLTHKRRHVLVRWPGGSVALSSTPSDRKATTALIASVRRQCR